MSEYQILAVIAGFVFLYCTVASRLERTRFSGAVVYVLCGFVLGPYCLKWVDLSIDGETLKGLAELTLAIVLFSDSSSADVKLLYRFQKLPARLLLIGLPLTILLGFVVGEILYVELSWVELALLATILAPTDAALGKPVVTNAAVPGEIREGLNVESGLNDGICVPVLLLFLAIAQGTVDGDSLASQVLHLPLQAIGIGTIVGLLFATSGAQLLNFSIRSGWIQRSWMQVPVVALALVCFAVAQGLGGSGFIACFVGGLVFGIVIKRHKSELLESAESSGDVMSMITWFAFGAMFIGECLSQPAWRPVVYALLSLTLVRMLPVFLAVVGLGIRLDSKLFMGWFGPRGLASIVFMVMVNEAKMPGAETLSQAVTWTILLSVVLHGISANPLSKAYGARVRARNGQV